MRIERTPGLTSFLFMQNINDAYSHLQVGAPKQVIFDGRKLTFAVCIPQNFLVVINSNSNEMLTISLK